MSLATESAEIQNGIALKLMKEMDTDVDELTLNRRWWIRLYNICLFSEVIVVSTSIIFLNLNWQIPLTISLAFMLAIQKIITNASKEEIAITHKLSTYKNNLGIKFSLPDPIYGSIEESKNSTTPSDNNV